MRYRNMIGWRALIWVLASSHNRVFALLHTMDVSTNPDVPCCEEAGVEGGPPSLSPSTSEIPSSSRVGALDSSWQQKGTGRVVWYTQTIMLPYVWSIMHSTCFKNDAIFWNNFSFATYLCHKPESFFQEPEGYLWRSIRLLVKSAGFACARAWLTIILELLF